MISFAGSNEEVDDAAKDQAIQAAVGLLGRVRGFDEVLSALQYQREHFDGTGSPGLISGEDIPLFARIIAAVNAYDEALSSGKSDRPMRTLAREALEEGRGSRFDPTVVDAILSAVEQEEKDAEEFDTEIELSPNSSKLE